MVLLLWRSPVRFDMATIYHINLMEPNFVAPVCLHPDTWLVLWTLSSIFNFPAEVIQQMYRFFLDGALRDFHRNQFSTFIHSVDWPTIHFTVSDITPFFNPDTSVSNHVRTTLVTYFDDLVAREFSDMFAFMHAEILPLVGRLFSIYSAQPFGNFDKFIARFHFLDRYPDFDTEHICMFATMFDEFMDYIKSGPTWYTSNCFTSDWFASAPLESDLLLQEHLQNH